MGVAPGLGVGVAPGFTTSATLIVTGDPTEGVIVTVAEYDPGFKLFVLTAKVTGELAPELSLPPRGEAVNQPTDGGPTVQPRPLPPVSVMLIVCDEGLLPCTALKDRLVLSTSIAGWAVVMVIGTVAGLPAVG